MIDELWSLFQSTSAHGSRGVNKVAPDLLEETAAMATGPSRRGQVHKGSQ